MSDQRCSFLDEFPLIIRGAEGEDESTDDNAGTGDENSNDAGNQSGEAAKETDDLEGIRKALVAERKLNKASSKRASDLQKEKDERELSEKSEVEQATTKAEKAEARADKLTQGFVRLSLNQAIRAAASNFIDTADAVDGIDRSKLVFEQDDDDPSIVTIDKKSVELAVKSLATSKPHYLKSGTNDGESTGSGFGGSQQKPEKDSEAAMRLKYPSLA